jgi:hypothetical protein
MDIIVNCLSALIGVVFAAILVVTGILVVTFLMGILGLSVTRRKMKNFILGAVVGFIAFPIIAYSVIWMLMSIGLIQ